MAAAARPMPSRTPTSTGSSAQGLGVDPEDISRRSTRRQTLCSLLGALQRRLLLRCRLEEVDQRGQQRRGLRGGLAPSARRDQVSIQNCGMFLERYA